MKQQEPPTIERAVAALQVLYEPDDDGYPVKLALDALGSILAEKAGLPLGDRRGLTAVLDSLDAPRKLRAGVEKLYEQAEGGEYGAGLSKKQARKINDLLVGVVDPLVSLIERYGRPPAARRRAGAAASKSRTPPARRAR